MDKELWVAVGWTEKDGEYVIGVFDTEEVAENSAEEWMERSEDAIGFVFSRRLNKAHFNGS